MTHAWCRDVARDEAVRAAEDGRTGPLPTLGECIDGMFPKSRSVTSHVKPENKGDGMATDGLRTERVVLEVTGAPGWRVQVNGIDVASVRVVEETHFDDLAQVAMERDAAIRERDALRAERITQALTADRFASAVSEADALRARVAQLEAAAKLAPDANADGEANHAAPAASGGGEQPRGWLSGDERLALDGARTILDQSGRTNIGITIDALLARSSPPEVGLPGCSAAWTQQNTVRVRDNEWLAALAAAGASVKEVSSE